MVFWMPNCKPMTRSQFAMPESKPWPLPDERGPESSQDFKLLDERFLSWLEDVITDSLTFIEGQLTTSQVPLATAQEITNRIRVNVLSEWTRTLITLDNNYNFFCYGQERNRALLQRFFRKQFGRQLAMKPITDLALVAERRLDKSGLRTGAYPCVHIIWFPNRIEILAESSPDQWVYRRILPASADGSEVETLIQEAQTYL